MIEPVRVASFLRSLTDRELDLMRHKVETEWARRIEERRAVRHEAARVRRLEATTIGLAERTTKYRAGGRLVVSEGDRAKTPRTTSPPGTVLATDRARKLRVIVCATCTAVFESPIRRGPAPRSCGACKGAT